MFTLAQSIFTLILYLFGALVLGSAAYPAILFLGWVWIMAASLDPALNLFVICVAAALSYFIFGLTLILVAGFVRIILGLNLKEGEYAILSLQAMRWYFVNALQLAVSNTFMNFILITPFAALFFKLMGAKVGKNVQINSAFCADLPLLEIGDHAVIGGHATVIGHSFEKGKLILRNVKIGRKAIIGLNAVVLPGCVIGEGAVVGAGAVLPKNTSVEPGSLYTGVPAKKQTIDNSL